MFEGGPREALKLAGDEAPVLDLVSVAALVDAAKANEVDAERAESIARIVDTLMKLRSLRSETRQANAFMTIAFNVEGSDASQCPLWVISGHSARQLRCPLYPRKQTFVNALGMSALGPKADIRLKPTVVSFATNVPQRPSRSETSASWQRGERLALL
jgi:hypothetical protein